ncbi:hypothetical protein E1295_12840 [Nonomuraea mesophila]|uniref:Uncharacterized protein n=1 Tax=Nonomuraea mesophila TaxID=2530382 RepID=A0A4R5FRN5_9ACTN|nr:hypothetical protein [Nonomuraea mesophila]TDE55825.1 hypothetical protein E1295_12840 [Nonomuraea mesophila]
MRDLWESLCEGAGQDESEVSTTREYWFRHEFREGSGSADEEDAVFVREPATRPNRSGVNVMSLTPGTGSSNATMQQRGAGQAVL